MHKDLYNDKINQPSGGFVKIANHGNPAVKPGTKAVETFSGAKVGGTERWQPEIWRGKPPVWRYKTLVNIGRIYQAQLVFPPDF